MVNPSNRGPFTIDKFSIAELFFYFFFCRPGVLSDIRFLGSYLFSVLRVAGIGSPLVKPTPYGVRPTFDGVKPEPLPDSIESWDLHDSPESNLHDSPYFSPNKVVDDGFLISYSLQTIKNYCDSSSCDRSQSEPVPPLSYLRLSSWWPSSQSEVVHQTYRKCSLVL